MMDGFCILSLSEGENPGCIALIGPKDGGKAPSGRIYWRNGGAPSSVALPIPMPLSRSRAVYALSPSLALSHVKSPFVLAAESGDAPAEIEEGERLGGTQGLSVHGTETSLTIFPAKRIGKFQA